MLERELTNIGLRGVAKRRNTGIVAGIAAVILAVLLIVSDLVVLWRLLLFPILYTAIAGLLQAHEAT